MCRWIEKVLSLGYGIAQSGDNSARHGEMAVPDFATKVMASTAYTSNQDSRSLEKEMSATVLFQEPLIFHVWFKFKQWYEHQP